MRHLIAIIILLTISGINEVSTNHAHHPVTVCQEDQLCWQPLIMGNHEGSMNGYQIRR